MITLESPGLCKPSGSRKDISRERIESHTDTRILSLSPVTVTSLRVTGLAGERSRKRSTLMLTVINKLVCVCVCVCERERTCDELLRKLVFEEEIGEGFWKRLFSVEGHQWLLVKKEPHWNSWLSTYSIVHLERDWKSDRFQLKWHLQEMGKRGPVDIFVCVCLCIGNWFLKLICYLKWQKNFIPSNMILTRVLLLLCKMVTSLHVSQGVIL